MKMSAHTWLELCYGAFSLRLLVFVDVGSLEIDRARGYWLESLTLELEKAFIVFLNECA